MISLLSSYAAGNAIGILLNPPSTAVKIRLLRNLTGVFVNQDDPIPVYEGLDKHIIDTAALDNGIAVFYQPFYFDGLLWTTDISKSVTPGQTMLDRSVDPLSLVRDRLDLGLNGLVTRGKLKHCRGIVPVLTSAPQIEDAVFPIVTVHLTSDAAETQFIGGVMREDVINADTTITEIAGWQSRVTLEIVLWSLNGDERKKYRMAIKTVLMACLSVFSSYELEEIDLQFSDTEDFQSYNAPIYMSNCTFRCLCPSAVTGAVPSIVDVFSNMRVV